MKYSVTYWEDEFSCIDSIIIEASSEEELRQMADNYYTSMPNKDNIAGAKWRLIKEPR